ncbi:MAG TPA: bifunctional 4-hydroxy-2-oxoglutarate aldolase/2-dehydro-3-deoxy-phosphogluconate aldolase, partial [Limnochordales bacterium]
MSEQRAVLERLSKVGIVPVVRVRQRETALRLVEALLAGGLEAIEITFTVQGAPEVIAAVSQRFPEVLVGAGTVLDEAAARAAVEAGARFVVSPGTVEPVVRAARRAGVAVMPGVLTPTEALRALELGADALKLFPASVVGPGYLKAVRAVLPGVIWCPTGGIDLESLGDWLRAGAAFVGVGSPLLGDVEVTGDY